MGILRHFQTLFCGVVGTEKNLVGEGYNEAPGFGFSRPQFVRGFFFRNFTFDFETILSLQPSPSLFTNAQCYAFVRIFTARQMLLSFEAKQFVSDKSLKPS